MNLAIIPARGGSKRIPRKNIKDFLGYPIIKYAIESAINSKCFDVVMVSTDDEEIAKVAKSFGAKVPFLRSGANSDDKATTADVILEVISEYKKQGINFDSFCCIYPTAVFITPKILKEAIVKLSDDTADAVISVAKFSHPIQRALKIEKGFLEMINSENLNKRTQDLEVSYYDAGQFYFLKTEAFLNEKKLFLKRSFPFELNQNEVQDIDNLNDWKIAELKYRIINH